MPRRITSPRVTLTALVAVALVLLLAAALLIPRLVPDSGAGDESGDETVVGTEASGSSPARTGERWSPEPGRPWQWQLAGTPAVVGGVGIYGMDGQETPENAVRDFADGGLRTICYVSAGSVEDWRPDAHRFPDAVIGKPMEGWKGESWLDIRRLDVLLPVQAARMDQCARKGFDAVEADNVDGYGNDTGFPLTAEDQLRYNRALARLAHERGLGIGLKNDVDQIAALEPDFDFAINEECFQHDECEAYRPFVTAGKAVLNVEYEQTPGRCEKAAGLGITSMLKNTELDAWRRPC